MFDLISEYTPAGDQPKAIKELIQGLNNNKQHQTLLGVTGSGKTFTLANVISKINRPILVLSHNKTLAAQLYSEFKSFFPNNAVEYFISYYDYYLPESYSPQTDTYIAKDSSINEQIEKLRLAATTSLVERDDVIVVASVSCIYGLGSPQDFEEMSVPIQLNDNINRDDLLRNLVTIQYTRNDIAPTKGEFRVSGDTIEIYQSHKDEMIRVEFWGDEIEAISRCDDLTGNLKSKPDKVIIFPSQLFVIPQEQIDKGCESILLEAKERVKYFEENGLLVEAQRIYQRTKYDVEMMREIGYCSGIENYSRHLSGRKAGIRPECLLDFFNENFLTIIDESHVTMPQVKAMYKADRSRKQTLIDHGFRLPSALDNRPLMFNEFEELANNTIFVSATPREYEIELSGDIVEQVVRPTGLLDPEIEIRPLKGQIDDIINEINKCAKLNERVIVTTLTKKNAERLADYLNEMGLKVKYMHSEIDALQRIKIISELRKGEFDALIGINLLREGIDIPEVTLVAILDADKEGFLRSETALLQVSGRAARNVKGRVILYADKKTNSINKVVTICETRREKQKEYNKEHNITPTTIQKSIRETVGEIISPKSNEATPNILQIAEEEDVYGMEEEDITDLIEALEKDMFKAAEKLEFERAADLRDKIKGIKGDNIKL